MEEVIKMRNIAHMMKVHFRDIAMARKAITSGICLFSYHLSPSQIEQEEFYSITPCWSCYKYDHHVCDCPDKDSVVCSGSAESGHTFRECRNKNNPKCLNCQRNHRTLAASCSIRKDVVKKKREESNKRKNQIQDRTYAEVTKLHQELPRMVESKQDTILNLNTVQSFKVMVITIQAHLANMAKPGTFGKTVRELLKLNNLPDVVLPDNAPSFEIFEAINGLNQQSSPIQISTQSTEENQEDEGSDMEIAAARLSDILPRPEDKSVRQKIEMYGGEEDRSRYTSEVTHTPANSPTRTETRTETQEEEILKKTDIRFTSSNDDRVPDSLSPLDLSAAIDRGRVKYVYRGIKVPEERILLFIREGKITSLRNHIRRVDRTIYKKIT